MTTPHLQEALTAYLAGELAGAELERTEAHLRACAECRLQLERLKRLNSLLAEDAPLEPSPDFVARVMSRADREKKVIAFKTRKVVAWVALAAAIVFAVLLLRVQKDVQPPGELSKRPPVEQKQPPQPAPVRAQQQAPPAAPELSPEDVELIAHLDELEDMELISNYDNLQELEPALLAAQTEHPQ